MSKELLKLSIVTPEKHVVTDEVSQVIAPGTEGDLGILYDHAALITLLRPGQLSYEKDNESTTLVVSGGYLEVTDNPVTVLAESAEYLDEIDQTRAERARDKAQELMEMAESDEEYQEAQKKLFRAIARLENTER